MSLPLPLHPLDLLRRGARALEAESLVHARRNALIAATALAQRRAELNDAEEFLAARSARAGREYPADEQASEMPFR
jgi:hypothetical protein